ncbi:MAG: CBS domain-containing protein [Alphaproteobacteria bacterium]|nr:CBS domain-containing protein [Alphaproteobacteria bacterium]
MPCHSAMIDNPLSVKTDEEVGKVLAKMKKAKTRFAAIIDKDDKLVGLFSYAILLKNLLPVSVAMADGLQLDVTVRAAPGIAKRLKKVYYLPVADFMERKVNAVHPDTPTWEGINALILHGEPILVVDPKTEKLAGMINGQSALEELIRLKDSES